MTWVNSEKKTCFVLNDGAIGYPGYYDAENKGDELSVGRLKSPPPVGEVGGVDTGRCVPIEVAEWRSALTVLSDEEGSDGSSFGRTPSRATSLRSCGRSPSLEPLPPVVHRKRKRLSSTSSTDRKRSRHPTTHFLHLPAEVLTPICLFSAFPDIISFHQTCIPLRRMIPPCLEVLDISQHPFTNPLAALLVRWSLSNMRLKYLCVSCGIQERYAGVVGFVMRSSPHLRVVDLKGRLPFHLVAEVVKHCGNLKELVNAPSVGDQVGEVPNPTLTSFVLSGSKSLNTVALSAVSGVPKGVPAADKLIHLTLRKLRLEGIGFMKFSSHCEMPMLQSASVFEGVGANLTMSEMMNIIWGSPGLVELTVAAGFQWSVVDVETLRGRCPGVERLRLKAGSDGAEHWDAASPTRQISSKTFHELCTTFSLKELHVEAAGWDPHWTAYHDVVGEDSLVLQTELDLLVSPLLRHLETDGVPFQSLVTVVLYGDVCNQIVWSVLKNCRCLERLEVYLLPHSEADDEMLRVEEGSKKALKSLHVHDGTTSRLTSVLLSRIGEKFPCLTSLGLVGLTSTTSIPDRGLESVMSSISQSLPPTLTHLVLGPVLNTSTELLCLIKDNPSLESLSLAWDGGELPTRDDEFPSALGLSTLTSLGRQINPNLTVRDVGCGHFNILL